MINPTLYVNEGSTPVDFYNGGDGQEVMSWTNTSGEDVVAHLFICAGLEDKFTGSDAGEGMTLEVAVTDALVAIEGITKGGAGVDLSINATAHGLVNDDVVQFDYVTTTTVELKGNQYKIAKTDVDNFTLVDTDSDAFTAWDSGGGSFGKVYRSLDKDFLPQPDGTIKKPGRFEHLIIEQGKLVTCRAKVGDLADATADYYVALTNEKPVFKRDTVISTNRYTGQTMESIKMGSLNPDPRWTNDTGNATLVDCTWTMSGMATGATTVEIKPVTTDSPLGSSEMRLTEKNETTIDAQRYAFSTGPCVVPNGLVFQCNLDSTVANTGNVTIQIDIIDLLAQKDLAPFGRARY
jgi:hypothetical protein